MIDKRPEKMTFLKAMYNYDNHNLDNTMRKRLMHNNIARTKAVDKFCKFIINCTNKKVAKTNPEKTLQYLKKFCENRLEINKAVRHETSELIHKINLEKKSNNDINGGVEWIR